MSYPDPHHQQPQPGDRYQQHPYPYPYPSPYQPPYPSPPPYYPTHDQRSPWGSPQVDPRSAYPAHHPISHEPLFQVRVTKHTGLLYIWVHERRTFTGTRAQCETAIRNAQLHNLLAGWWGVVSFLVMNWLALFENLGARKALRRQASAHPYFAQQPRPPQTPHPQAAAWPPLQQPSTGQRANDHMSPT